jgi:hypothetical protein
MEKELMARSRTVVVGGYFVIPISVEGSSVGLLGVGFVDRFVRMILIATAFDVAQGRRRRTSRNDEGQFSSC